MCRSVVRSVTVGVVKLVRLLVVCSYLAVSVLSLVLILSYLLLSVVCLVCSLFRCPVSVVSLELSSVVIVLGLSRCVLSVVVLWVTVVSCVLTVLSCPCSGCLCLWCLVVSPWCRRLARIGVGAAGSPLVRVSVAVAVGLDLRSCCRCS